MNKTVGILILNYNCEHELNICLQSILRAKTDILNRVVVVENGSSENSKTQAKLFFDNFCAQRKDHDDIFIELQENLGFVGGNNVGIKALLEQQDVSHLMLLNADTVVSNCWLENLMKHQKPVAVPVSNAGGGFQTVFCDVEVKKDEQAIEIVFDIAKRRHNLFKDFSATTQHMSLFAMLIEREVFEKIGLLDERFFPGYFEDDDFSIRLNNAGIKSVVARDCYIHHFGESSFGKVLEKNDILLLNLERFEEKWGIKHEGREHLIYQSALMDFEKVCKNSVDSVVYAELKGALEYAMSDRKALTAHYTKLLEKSNIGNFEELPFSEIPKQIVHKIKRKFKR